MIRVEHYTVRPDRIVAIVDLGAHAHTTTPELLAAVERRYPHLRLHSCVNAEGSTFGDVADHTSVAHLIEHMVIEGQVEAEGPDGHGPFIGMTRWIDEPAGRARIEVSFADDRIALAAFRDAVALLNSLA